VSAIHSRCPGYRSSTAVHVCLLPAILFLVTVLLARSAAAASDVTMEVVRAGKRVTAVRTIDPIVLDGRLDEESWQLAPPATGFYQQQPDEGLLATEYSEVRFVYDDRALYVGGRFFHRGADGVPIVNELKRDFSERDGDVIAIVLDTFRDAKNASNFMTNPAGAVRDSQSHDDGRQTNQHWDAVWFVRTARFSDGWSMEMAIPFKSLRFRRSESQEWGLNILRLIRRKNEVAVWAPVPRQFTPFKVSYAGVLAGLEGVSPGFNFRIKAFATVQGVSTDADLRRWRGESDGGLDIKYGLSSSLTLDATYRTDFSQVEADEQQVNLTRFSLFFPEKREFFLENQGAFGVGDQSLASASGRRDLVPFFSRRIGLTNSGEVIPIRGGLRLSGRQGHYGIGLLQMWTDGETASPRTSYTAARLSRNVGPNASVGAIYMAKIQGQDNNAVIGADLRASVRPSFDLDVFLLRSNTTDRGSGWAGRGALTVNENRYSAHLAYTNVGPEYRNDLGFVQRSDVALVSWEYERNLRPRRTYRWVRTFTVGGEGDFFGDSAHHQLLTRLARTDFSAEFADGGRLGLDVDWNYERLSEAFAIHPGLSIQAGEYRFHQLVPFYSSDRSRWLSGSVRLTLGEFWSGQISGLNTSARVRISERLAASVSSSRDRITLPEGQFLTNVARLRVDYSFSTQMFVGAFIQYNSSGGVWTSNVRFNLIHRPLSDVYVVLNGSGGGQNGSRSRAVIVKYTHLVAF
jgi:hypothetical protein